MRSCVPACVGVNVAMRTYLIPTYVISTYVLTSVGVRLSVTGRVCQRGHVYQYQYW